MKKRPLFITLIIAAAIIGVVAVILFVKDVKVNPVKKQGKDAEPEPEPDEIETEIKTLNT